MFVVAYRFLGAHFNLGDHDGVGYEGPNKLKQCIGLDIFKNMKRGFEHTHCEKEFVIDVEESSGGDCDRVVAQLHELHQAGHPVLLLVFGKKKR